MQQTLEWFPHKTTMNMEPERRETFIGNISAGFQLHIKIHCGRHTRKVTNLDMHTIVYI